MRYFCGFFNSPPVKRPVGSSALRKCCGVFPALILIGGVLFTTPVFLSAQCSLSFINCPTQVTLVDCDGSGNEVLHWPLVTANPTGSCTDFSLVQTSGPMPGSMVPLGSYSIAYTAKVSNIGTGIAMTGTCSFVVSVTADQQAPAFSYCPPDITVLGVDNGAGNCTTQVFWPSPITTDNCGNPLNSQSNISCGATLTNGVRTVSYVATDEAQNTAVCSFTVTVLCEVDAPETGTSRLVLRIFPNPNPGDFSVELPIPAPPNLIFRIVNLPGRLLLEQPTLMGLALQTVQAGDLPAGLYFLQVVSEGRVLAVEKFVKQ